MNQQKIKILLLAADPMDTTSLQLGEEVRAIDEALQMSRLREHIELVSHWAVRVDDIVELLLRHRPTFIHFSGHGSPNEKIIVQNAAGYAVEIDEESFAELLRVAGKTVKCAFLNACYSDMQASLIAEYVPAVIGVSGEILDDDSVIFAKTFYLGLGSGESIDGAFRLGCAQIRMYPSDEAANIHLLGEGSAVAFQINTADIQKDTGINISNSTIKGMIQENYGDVSITFNESSD